MSSFRSDSDATTTVWGGAPGNSEPGSTVLPCQPVLQADHSNLWSTLDSELQRIYAAMKAACSALGIEAYISRKNAFEFHNQILFEAWIPQQNDPNLTERVWTRIHLEPKPWHRFPIEYGVRIFNRGHEKALGVFGALSDEQVRQLINYLVQGGLVPAFAFPISVPLRPWKNLRNVSTAIKPDYLAMVLSGLGPLAGLAFLSSLSMMFSSDAFGAGVVVFFVAIIWATVCYGLLYLKKREPMAVRSTGQPHYQPRVLRAYDSWQAVLSGAGPSRDIFYERFLALLEVAPIPDMEAVIEQVSYRVLGELVAREQIMLSARRAMMYCQIYPFGSDLYVGWQSFLNRGRWVGKDVLQGFDAATGRRIKLESVVPGQEALNEYDFADTNCLTEWTHAQMVTLIKQLMAELKIDQEIDFKIVRGDRAKAEAAETAPEKKTLGGFFHRKH